MAAVLDVFAELLIEKLWTLAEEEVSMLIGVKDEVEKMKSTMEKIRDSLKYAEENDTATKSVKQLRDIMYDADDIFDIWMMKLRQPNHPAVHSPFNCFSSCFRSLNYRHQIGLDIKRFNNKLDEIVRLAKFQNTIRKATENNPPLEPAVSVSVKIRKDTSLNIVGHTIEETADKLITRIVGDSEARCVIFAITGMGGIGKTTLARKIFNDKRIASNFPKRIWLRISKTYSEINVLKELIRNLGGSHGEAQSREELETKLDAIQLPESLFLVLDDLWNSDVWYKLLKVHMNRRKCKILVTTRDYTIAFSLSLEANIQHVGKMDIDSCWHLLCKEVFQDDQEEDIRELMPLGYKIVEKCDGLPLAVKAVAGILREKERRRVEWRKVLESEIWTMAKISEVVPSALYLSYKHLSTELRQCFLYCSLIAVSGEMYDEDLMRYWIDEGFIVGRDDNRREEKAEEYYRQLVSRNLLQPDPSVLNGSVCTMHDLLQSLGRFLIEGEAICIKEGQILGAEGLSNSFKVRRLLTISDPAEISTLPTDIDPQYLRAFIHKSSHTRVENGLLERLSKLRILVLVGLNVKELPDSIGDLFHLRHLDLDRSEITKIPNSIGSLANLQTLRAGACKDLRELPVTITELRNLRFLNVQNTPLTHVPKGISKLTNLNTIRGLVIGHSSNVIEEKDKACDLDDVQCLSNLRALRLHMLHRSRTNATSVLDNKRFLKSLVLSESLRSDEEAPTLSEEQIQRSHEIYNCLSPPSSLESLMILNFPMVEFPTWLMSNSLRSSFPNLTTLTIRNAKSCGELPLQLCRLPELKNFRITGNDTVIKIGQEFFESQSEVIAFRKLETLRFEKMTKLEEWSSSSRDEMHPNKKAFPKLSKLVIDDCPELKALPGCLSLATNLKTLEIVNCPSLVRVGNFHALENLNLETRKQDLPPWLSNLALQRKFNFHMRCTAELLQDCLRGSRHWNIIGQIQDVTIDAIESNYYMRNTMRNSDSYQTNMPPVDITVHPNVEPYINKSIEQYEDIALTNGNDCARSIGESTKTPMVQNNKTVGGPSSVNLDDMNTSQGSRTPGSSSSMRRLKKTRSKRSRHINQEEAGSEIAKSLEDIARAFDHQKWSDMLYATIMEIKEFPEEKLEAAFEYLMLNKTQGHIFLSRKHEAQVKWLEKYLIYHNLS